MSVDSIRDYCLSFPRATEKLQWGDSLCFKIDKKVGGKIFTILGLDDLRLCFKCTPETFAELVEREDIRPAPYVGRYKWVMLDRLDALHVAVKAVRRGGTVSVSGVYGGEVDPMPMMEMFDRGIQLRMGQAHVRRWIDDLMPLVSNESDPLGLLDFATHHLPLEEAPHGYEIFRDKAEGCLKVVLQP